MPIRRPDGTRVVVEYRAVARVQPGLHLSVLRDVTEREGLVQQVRAERGRLADVFQQAPSFMCVLAGPEHVFERANDRYLQLVGHRDILGRPVREAFPEVEGQGFFELLDRVYRTGEAVAGSDVRVALARQPGQPPEERYLDFVYQPVRDPDGAVTGVLVQGVDLTDRKRAEEALARLTAESERLRRLYETALSNTADFNYTFDLDGRFTFVNAALLALWGKRLARGGREELLRPRLPARPGRPAPAANPPGDRHPAAAPGRDAVHAVRPGEREYEYIFVPVVGAGGAVEAVAGSTRDITDRKALEADAPGPGRPAAGGRPAQGRVPGDAGPRAPQPAGPDPQRRPGHPAARPTADPNVQRSSGLIERQVQADDPAGGRPARRVAASPAGKIKLQKGPVELAAVVGPAVETARPLIDARRHELAVTLPPEAGAARRRRRPGWPRWSATC